MSTNTTTIHSGSVQYARGALGALLAVILLAAAAMFALNAGAPQAGTAPASDDQVQNALIDHRAGERAPLRVDVPSAKFWAEFRAGEREMR